MYATGVPIKCIPLFLNYTYASLDCWPNFKTLASLQRPAVTDHFDGALSLVILHMSILHMSKYLWTVRAVPLLNVYKISVIM